MHQQGRRRTARTAAGALLATAALVLAGLSATAPAQAARAGTPVPDLHLVTLTGPGTSGGPADRAALLAEQDAVLGSVGAAEPTYRWTAALNGFAAPLTAAQVAALQDDPAVARVEANAVRPMAGRVLPAAALRAGRGAAGRGGAGVVVGVIDSGVSPDSPLFADVPGLGPDGRFTGGCAAGEGWSPETCNRKLVGASWWVAGFGQDRIRSSETLSARDDIGHGTQLASVIAGNAAVSVRMQGRTVGRFSGAAPRARLAVYKACWAAPDPRNDGCATADLVSAIDRATADGVDVLNLAVGGPAVPDTVDLALLGAAEADVVVVAAAGNAGRSTYAAHAVPWVTTVGAVRGTASRGRVSVVGGPSLTGASRARRGVGRTRLVLAERVAAAGASVRAARQCRPGSLDARRVAGRAVLCERGGIGRIDKSAAVSLADGAAMVLVNTRRGSVVDDFHSLPTVHLDAAAGARLRRWARTHPDTRITLAPVRGDVAPNTTAPWSPPGDARGSLLKPDLVALGEGVLGAVPPRGGRSWALFSGTSAATARVAGAAAVLRSAHDWSAPRIRSVLATGAVPLPGASTLEQGAGRLPGRLPRAALALDVHPSAYRRALEDPTMELNDSSLLARRAGSTRRWITNLGSRAEYFSVSTPGFTRHRVRVTPLAVRLAPGESARLRITVSGPSGPGRVDDGAIVWTGARGSVTRIPVAIAR